MHLKKLNCCANKYIYDVNHLSDFLEELNCGGRSSKIDQKGISRLKKKILHCDLNNHIKDLNHFADTLEHLSCNHMEIDIDQKGVSQLKKIKTIAYWNNSKIDHPYITKNKTSNIYLS